MRVTTSAMAGLLMLGSAHGAEKPIEIELSPEVREFLEETATIRAKVPITEALTAIVLETGPGTGMTVFIDATGTVLLAGSALDMRTKENIAEQLTRTHFPEPGPDQMFREAQQQAWIVTGQPQQGVDPIYIIADTQCGYCHEIARQIAARRVTREIRWVLVGFGGVTSRNQAAGLLTAPEDRRARALWALLTGQARGEPEEISGDQAAVVARNDRWAERWRVTGTPVMLIPHQGQIHRVIGLPQSALWDIIAAE